MRKDRSKNLKPLERSRTSCPPSSQTKKRSSGPVFDPTMRLKEDVKCQYCGLALNTGSQPMKTHCSRQCRQNHYVYRKTGRRPLSNAQVDRAVSSFALANYTHNIHFKPSYLGGLYRFTCALVILSLSTVAITTPALAASKPNKTEVFQITAYCSCVKCCGKSDAITASGKPARPNHTCALNWLPFGTKVNVNGKIYTVEDRGAESLFGTYYHRKGAKKKIKHIDIYFASHREAKNFGVKWLPVEVLHG